MLPVVCSYDLLSEINELDQWYNGYCAGSSVIDRWFEPRLDLTKDYRIGMFGFSASAPHDKEKEQRMVGLESE